MVHLFKIDDVFSAVDTNSGSVHILDEITYDLLQDECFRTEEELNKLLNKYSKEEIDEAIGEIEELIKNGMLYTEPVNVNKHIKTAVKALCLNVAHDCNLKCDYCFASQGNFGGTPCLMPFEVGKKALDFLVANSGNRINLEVDFFGGEPLMNFDVVKQLVHYGRSIEKEHNKHFRFTTTTNGVLLDDDKIDFINENMDNVVLSLDGRKEVNDRMRKTINNQGSYDIIVEKFKKLVEKRKDKSYFARGTFTAYNLDFSEDVKHMHELGFKSISVEPVVTEPTEPYALLDKHIDKLKSEYENLARYFVEANKNKENGFDFFHFFIDFDNGPCLYKRSIGCGAGVEYLAVTPEGDFYPCHQFVGDERFIIGNVDNGIVKKEICNGFGCVTVNSKEKCRNCWAKYYCSGGCHANAFNFNGTIKEPYSVGCELEKKRVECAIYIKAKQQQNME
ncbi:thioether cross-link-forming SCIFF peptide maturase [Sedimentibacter sp. zth1]|uniref:thioether cross-link-forming SCIFF peptide maturase n=1 Tax=Sedimentibacter sp. zth1 TaxID=2816908 RepID=UPI001A92C59E|nr:thioether cross-link-forming SCIFF peptide maturase [Sedimentibacter sp. zth1]QSX06327.1 thioether cross-link-forming SCIFF peptide maturase [Sedimentibacter sp. zth1]